MGLSAIHNGDAEIVLGQYKIIFFMLDIFTNTVLLYYALKWPVPAI